MTITIPGKAQTAFKGNMQVREAIELPFPVPAFFIINGDTKLAALKNVQYYGGWGCNVEKVREASEHYENVPYPIPHMPILNMLGDDGKPYDIFAARSIIVAPIGMRQFSTVKDENGNKRRVAPFTKGARPGIQILSMLATRDENKIIYPWAPVLLTANGYQVSHVQKAFESYRKAIKPIVKKVIPGADDSVLNLFWMFIGTFGAERKAIPAGEKSITPVGAWIPENLDEKTIEAMYVGDAIAEYMADISAQAQEWLKAFQKPVAQHASEDPGEPQYVDEPGVSQLPPEDDIPF